VLTKNLFQSAGRRSDRDLIVLCDAGYTPVGSPIRYEQVPGQPDPFPHIYGPLNLDAVVEARPHPHHDHGQKWPNSDQNWP
jgi:uncharacterized protein (DUF952 family)